MSANKMKVTVDSHPKYSEMILEAIRENKKEGKLNASRQAILKFVTGKYQLDPTMASRHVNLNLKKMLESGAIKQAAAAGRKGAGSYRLGTKGKEKKIIEVKKVTKVKKTTKEKKGKKVTKTKTKGKTGSAKVSEKSKAAGKVKTQKKARKTPTKPKKSGVAKIRI